MEYESQKVVLEKTNRIDKIVAILIKRPKYQYCKCTNGPYPTTNKHFFKWEFCNNFYANKLENSDAKGKFLEK